MMCKLKIIILAHSDRTLVRVLGFCLMLMILRGVNEEHQWSTILRRKKWIVNTYNILWTQFNPRFRGHGRFRFQWARTGAFRALWPFRNFSWSLQGPFLTTAGGVQLLAALAGYPPSTFINHYLMKIISSNRVRWGEGVAGLEQKAAGWLPETYRGHPHPPGVWGASGQFEVDGSEGRGDSWPGTKAHRWLPQASPRGWGGAVPSACGTARVLARHAVGRQQRRHVVLRASRGGGFGRLGTRWRVSAADDSSFFIKFNTNSDTPLNKMMYYNIMGYFIKCIWIFIE